jgi:E3 ubiquitin-protein ligase DOA10
MANRIIDEKIPRVGLIFVSWVFETSLIALLPLFVYWIAAYSLSRESPIRSTEWTMISTIVYGDALRSLFKFFNSGQTPRQRSEINRTVFVILVSLGLLGVILSSVFLAFSVAEQLDNDRALDIVVYYRQMFFLYVALLFSAFTHIWLGLQTKRKG